MDEKMETSYETIAEKLKKQLGYKVGILSSVNLNHATPAAFYAHQPSRNNYYEIGQELIASDFDYFAGGGLKKTTGNIVGIRIVEEADDVMLITDTGTIIRLNVAGISVLGRSTQGVTLMRTNEGKVVSIEKISEKEEE